MLDAMVDALTHRGPDDRGVHLAGDVGIGMRRLAIIDPALGKQPISTPDSRYTIVFNGEIYNYRQLRDSLAQRGVSFQTHSDTEVLLTAYALDGPACLPSLRGMFTLAIHDSLENSLFLARDRLGIKPLYYTVDHSRLLFASEIKALLKHPTFSAKPNLAAAVDYLTLRYVPGPRTLLQGVQKFPPGHFMIWKGGEYRLERYWTPPRETGIFSCLDEALEEFSELFETTTRMHMVADREVGAFLSGGLDSTAIVASLRRQFTESVKTFCVGFGWEGDELATAANTARALNCNHHEVICRAEHMSLLPQICYHLDEPVGDAIVLPMYLVSQLAAQHVTVVLAGEGADEMLGGYFMHRVLRQCMLYRRMVPGGGRKAAAGAASLVPASLLNLLFDYPGDLGAQGKKRLLDFLSVIEGQSLTDAYLFLISLFGESELASFLTPAARQEAAANPGMPLPAASTFNELLALQFDHWLPDDILMKQDKMTMANSIEGRVPFMDHVLVEFMLSLPRKFKINRKGNKYLLRKYIGQAYTPDFATRRKKAFYIPVDVYLDQQPLKGYVDELLSESSVRRRGLLEPDRVRALRNSGSGTGFLRGKQIFSLAMLELWFRIFIDQESGWL